MASACGVLGAAVAAACYTSGKGTPPNPQTFYYPIALTVSAAGNVLYAVNSDFDLQFTNGTVQSYDLTQIRNDTVRLMLGLFPGAYPFDAGAGFDAGTTLKDSFQLPFTARTDAGCPNTQNYPPLLDPNHPDGWNGQPQRLPIGEACAPPMDEKWYWRDSIFIGAFATDIQLSRNKDRLFVPVRGNATITWVDVTRDESTLYVPPIDAGPTDFTAFSLSGGEKNCGAKGSNQSCDVRHQAGRLQDTGNSRQLTMPGEPFAMAISDDGTAIALTHQAENQSSLFLSGQYPGNTTPADPGSGQNFDTSIQFVVNNMPLGGDGIASIPHDVAALPNQDPANPLRPAFLQTTNQGAEVDLLRYYTDEGYEPAIPADGGINLADAGLSIQVGSSNLRPFLVKERVYSVAAVSGGTNNRGIAIDPTPRIACEANAVSAGFALTSPEYVACAQTPARVFIATRGANSSSFLMVGQIGAMSEEGATYDPDAFSITGQVPLSAGASNVYVAPVVDSNGNYAVRVFVVCFDSQTIAVYDPDAQRIENVITTGPGPFGMAFDPFDLTDVALHKHVPLDPRSSYTRVVKGQAAGSALLKYRFAYVTSFTDSYVQVLDLDGSFQDDRLYGVSAYQTMVYTLGIPTMPVSSN